MHTGADAEIMYMRTLRRWLAATLNKHHVHNTGIRGSNVQSDARCGRINTKETQTNFLLVGPLMVPLSELLQAWSPLGSSVVPFPFSECDVAAAR